jgi:hypothetical protein
MIKEKPHLLALPPGLVAKQFTLMDAVSVWWGQGCCMHPSGHFSPYLAFSDPDCMLPLISQLYLFNFHDQAKFLKSKSQLCLEKWRLECLQLYVKIQGLGQRCNQVSVSPWSLQEASQGIAFIRYLVCSW